MKRKLLTGLATLAGLFIIVAIVVLATAPGRELTPAEFEVSNLDVNPEEVEPGQTVTVTVDVQNVGGRRGTHELKLIVDGLVEESKDVTLDGGEHTTAVFIIQRETKKSYSIEVAGLSKSFEVVAPAAFEISNLTISPSMVEPGDEISITALVVNVGGLQGTRALELTINGESRSREVSLGPGESTTVAFTVTQESEGTYQVWLEGLSGSFEVVIPATMVGGIIHEDTTWTLADSPYEITETVQIPTGVTLTIEPGVTVTRATSGAMFLLHGEISAHGTPDKRITFNGGGDSDFFSAKGSHAHTFLSVRHAIIRNGLSFWPPTGHEQYGHFHLRDSVLEDVLRYSYVWYPEQDVYVERNIFRNSAGFSVGHSEASVYIRWNRFESRPSLPEYMDYCVQNWAAYGGQTIVQYNSFLNAGEVALQLPGGYSSAAMIATDNYWGTTNTEVIEDMIYDKNDDITSAGYIVYEPILVEPHPQTPSP